MSIPRSNKVLPRHIDPRKMAIQSGSIKGSAPLAVMSRLAEVIEDDRGEVMAELSFCRDQQGRYLVSAAFTATVNVKCQRCLQAMARELSGSSTLAVIADEQQAEQLPREIDPWLVEQETADLLEMLEEELLLVLPIVSYHDDASCGGKISFALGSKEKSGKASPFDVLSELKKRQH